MDLTVSDASADTVFPEMDGSRWIHPEFWRSSFLTMFLVVPDPLSGAVSLRDVDGTTGVSGFLLLVVLSDQDWMETTGFSLLLLSLLVEALVVGEQIFWQSRVRIRADSGAEHSNANMSKACSGDFRVSRQIFRPKEGGC